MEEYQEKEFIDALYEYEELLDDKDLTVDKRLIVINITIYLKSFLLTY